MSIPKIVFRTVPKVVSPQVEKWWDEAISLHDSSWEFLTYQDPIDASLFPRTSPYWKRCVSGAQLAGLIRLEGLWNHGGIYLDSDVQVYKNLGPLLQLEGFAGHEDPGVIPDAVLGAKRAHPAIDECIELAISRLKARSGDWRTDGPWGTGPGVTTTVLPGRDDFLIFPPQVWYAVHYTEKDKLSSHTPNPWEYGLHWWHNSWNG